MWNRVIKNFNNLWRLIRLTQKNSNRKLDRRYDFNHIGISGLFFQELSIRVVPFFPGSLSANRLTFLGFISSLLVFLFLIRVNSIAGLFILITLWLDHADGVTARKLGQTSKSGQIFDAMVDLSLYIAIIIAFYINGYKSISFLILALYATDIYLRFQLGHSPHTLGPKTDSFESTTPFIKGAIKGIKTFINPFLNHTDVMTLLAILIIIDIRLIKYWLVYDFFRRLANVLTKLPEIYRLYINDKIYLH